MVQILPPAPPSFGERLAKGLGEGLSQGISEFAKTYQERKRQKQIGDYFTSLAKEHEGDPMFERLATAFSAPGLDVSEKGKLARTLLGGQDPFRQGQQTRLEKDAVLKRYNSRIREIDEELRSSTNFEEKEGLQDLRRALQQERDQMLNFPALEELGESSSEDMEEDEDEIIPRRKIKFDPRNPKHKAIRDKVLNQARGDRKKAGEILSRKFAL